MKSSGDRMIDKVDLFLKKRRSVSLWELTITPGNYVYTVKLNEMMYTNEPSTGVST